MSKKANGNLFTVYLDALKVKYTRRFTRKLYAQHPHKYNMYGLSKMLSDYRIPNEGLTSGNPAYFTYILVTAKGAYYNLVKDKFVFWK